MLSENLREVHQRIEAAALRAGRKPDDITLIAVSKTKPVEAIQEAYDAGERYFGENYVQEITEKTDRLPGDISWHMIGHLQRNKIKYIIDKVDMIHSVDSLRLAEAISKEAVKHDLTMPILLEVNIACEETKFGFREEELPNALEEVRKLPNIVVKGLMTSAPFTDNPEDNRLYFRRMRQLLVDLNAKNTDNEESFMDILSMGMTGDFEVAIEEGATHIRVGTAIFGARDYSKTDR